MTAEVTKVYKEHIPSTRLIGKRYSDEHRNAAGSFGDRWDEWSANGWFEEIGKLGALPESEGSSYGIMRMSGNQFEYWIGMLFPEHTEVPVGFDHADLAEGLLQSGDRVEAKRETLSALEIAPTYERAQELLLKLVDGAR